MMDKFTSEPDDIQVLEKDTDWEGQEKKPSTTVTVMNAEDAIDPEELKKGIAHEMEHTDDPAEAEKIAREHLSKIRNYYSRLDDMESQASDEGDVVSKAIKKSIDVLEKAVKRMKAVEMYSEEVPEELENLFEPMARVKLHDIYADLRTQGNDEATSLKTATRLVARAFKNTKILALKGLEAEVKKIQSRIVRG